MPNVHDICGIIPLKRCIHVDSNCASARGTIDTLAYAQKLEAAGIQPKYAEAHAEALSEVIAKEMVTEDRLKIILNNELKTRFDDLDVDLNTRFEDMVKQINKEQRTIFAELKSYLLLRILGGMSIGFTILAVIIGIFSR